MTKLPINTLGLLVIVLLFSGCSSTTENIALGVAGGVGAYAVGNTFATRSSLEVQVETFNASKLQGSDSKKFKQSYSELIKNLGTHLEEKPSAASFRKILNQMQPYMDELTVLNEEVTGTITKQKDLIERLPEGSLKDLYEESVRLLEKTSQANKDVLKRWCLFRQDYLKYTKNSLDTKELDALANHIQALRMTLYDADDKIAELRRSSNTVGGFLVQLKTFHHRYIEKLKNYVKTLNNAANDLANQSYPELQLPTHNDADFEVTVVDSLFQLLSAMREAKKLTADASANADASAEAEAAVPNPNFECLAKSLSKVYATVKTEDLQSLFDDNNLKKAMIKDQLFKGISPLSALSQLDELYDTVIEKTYASVGVDVNLGPIRNELLQVLLTPEAIDIVTDTDNEQFWQSFSYACSYGAAGNHDVIIYLENLGLPIVKNSAFDPTKFQVANGLMFRTAFSGLVDVLALPMDTTEGDGDATTPVGSLNLAKAKATREEVAGKINQKQKAMLEALEKVITYAEANDFTQENAKTTFTDAAAKLNETPAGDAN